VTVKTVRIVMLAVIHTRILHGLEPVKAGAKAAGPSHWSCPRNQRLNRGGTLVDRPRGHLSGNGGGGPADEPPGCERRF